jgi:hypothetical protein
MAQSGGWDVQFYEDEDGREPCREWADDLSLQKRAAFMAAVQLALQPRGLELVGTEFCKSLSSGLYELRVRWSAAEIRRKFADLDPEEVGGPPEKILLRVFFCTAGRKIIMLMSGYDKGEDPGDHRQQREIAKARKLLTAHREAERRRK